METAVSTIVKVFALAGGTIPILLIIIGYIEVYFNANKIPLATVYGFYLWPTRLMLLGVGEDITLVSLIALVVSIFLNSLLYTIAGWLIGLVWKLRPPINY